MAVIKRVIKKTVKRKSSVKRKVGGMSKKNMGLLGLGALSGLGATAAYYNRAALIDKYRNSSLPQGLPVSITDRLAGFGSEPMSAFQKQILEARNKLKHHIPAPPPNPNDRTPFQKQIDEIRSNFRQKFDRPQVVTGGRKVRKSVKKTRSKKLKKTLKKK